MRITKTYAYELHDQVACELEFCLANYCAKHRLLWRDCETAQRNYDNTYDTADCPRCMKRPCLQLDRAIDADLAHAEHGE